VTVPEVAAVFEALPLPEIGRAAVRRPPEWTDGRVRLDEGDWTVYFRQPVREAKGGIDVHDPHQRTHRG
jgi:hypothetical protein